MKIVGRNGNNFRYAQETSSWQTEQCPEWLLRKVKKASAKQDCTWNSINTEITHNSYTDNQDAEIVKDVANFGLLINSNRAYSQEIKKKLRLKRAAMEELGKVTKSKDVSLETRAKIIYTRVPHYYVQMWTLDSEEGWWEKNDSSEIRGWRTALQTPWTAGKMNKRVLQLIRPNTELEANVTTLKLSYFRRIMKRHGSLEKTMMLGKQRWREKRRTNYEIGWLYRRSCKHQDTGAELGCWGQGIADIPHSQSPRVLEPTQQLTTHTYDSRV